MESRKVHDRLVQKLEKNRLTGRDEKSRYTNRIIEMCIKIIEDDYKENIN